MRAILLALVLCGVPALARAQDWVDQLTSPHGGLCCSNNDGQRVGPPDWDTGKTEASPYKVKHDGVWIDVPKAAVVGGRNQDGIARVWYYTRPDENGNFVRCFLPGALS